MWSDLRYRLRAVFRRGDVEQELDDELAFHIECEAEKHVRAGVPRGEALRLARLAFGGVNRIKDDTRDSRGIALLEHVALDVRYAVRGLRARPLFSAVVVATLALGVGVNTAMFGIVDRTLFRPPAYLIDPPSVNRLYVSWTESDGRRQLIRTVEYPRYVDFQKFSQSFSQLAGFSYRNVAVGEAEEAKDLRVGIVTGEFFDFFDAKPTIGRFFGPQEDRPPVGDAVAVLGFDYWQSRYAARRDVIGAPIKIGSTTYRIIGVAPRGFDGVSDHHAPVAFIPVTTFGASLRPSYYRRYSWNFVEVLARRKPGVAVDAASADFANAFRQSWLTERAINPSTPPVDGVHAGAVAGPIQLARGPMAGSMNKIVAWIGGVALIVLLVACANVANLLLARALRRRREMAVRRAIGGTRGRLVQQMFTETLVLAVVGTTAGLLGARAVAGGLRALLVETGDRWPVVGDTRTVVFAVALTLAIALLAGILPALHAGRGDLAGSLKAGVREGAYRQSRARTVLLLFQTALSVVLLVGAGLFLRSLQRVRALPLGYDVAPLVYMATAMRGVKLNAVEQAALADRLLAEARAMPGVLNATFALSIPFAGSERHTLYVPGIDSVWTLGRFLMQASSPEYFTTLGTRILRGRGLSAEDRANAPRVAVVSEAMAKVLWKADDPIGKCFRIESDTVPCTTVVGVAENIRTTDITAPVGEFMYYVPMPQYLATIGSPEGTELLVRVRGRPEEYVAPLRARLQRQMPGASYVTVTPFHEIVDPTMRSWTSGARMFLVFGVLALTLAAIGLYAVIAFSVVQRTQEIGVRIALGAQAADVLGLVVGEGVRVTIGGVAIGAAIAAIAGGSLASLLFGVSPRDPLTYAVVAATLIVVGVLATAIPAARATRVDPNVALRAD